MAYTKTTWAAGDTVTSTKLNKIENQLETLSNSGSSLFVTLTWSGSTVTADKTYSEIASAIQRGQIITAYIYENSSGAEAYMLLMCMAAVYDVNSTPQYKVYFQGPGNDLMLGSSTADGVLSFSNSAV